MLRVREWEAPQRHHACRCEDRFQHQLFKHRSLGESWFKAREIYGKQWRWSILEIKTLDCQREGLQHGAVQLAPCSCHSSKKKINCQTFIFAHHHPFAIISKKNKSVEPQPTKNVFPCFHHLSGNGIPTVTIGSSKLFLGKVKSLENSSTVYNSFRIHTYHISHCILRPQKIMDESTCVYIYILLNQM